MTSRAHSSGPAQQPLDSPCREIKSVKTSRGQYYSGYPEELIAARLIAPGQFPGDQGQRKTASRWINADGRNCRATKSGMKLHILVMTTPAEKLVLDIRWLDKLALNQEGSICESILRDITKARARLFRLGSEDASFRRFMSKVSGSLNEG